MRNIFWSFDYQNVLLLNHNIAHIMQQDYKYPLPPKIEIYLLIVLEMKIY